MADTDFSKVFSEHESDEISLETSVPTDMTLSPELSNRGVGREEEEEEERRRRRTGSKVTRQLIERKQLLHDLQLLKIELSQKNLVVENMKADGLQRTEELEEKLHDALHQKQILQARLESELRIQQQESRRRQESTGQQLEEVRARQQQLEEMNERLREKAGDVKRSLRDLRLSEERYYELRGQGEDDWSLRDFVAVSLYELSKPLHTEISQLRMRNSTLEDELKNASKQLLSLQKNLDEEREAHGEVRVKFQKLSLDLSDTKSQLKQDIYRIENFDQVKIDRDNLHHDQTELQRQYTVLEASHEALQKQRDELIRQMASCKQSLALLQQDKDYLTQQRNDSTNRCALLEDKALQLSTQLDAAKQAREEMYEKYVASRDQYKSEYEIKLREELGKIHHKTNTEIDRLQTSTKEMYERENRNLREARNMALSEKERAQAAERELSAKYEKLLTEFRQLHMSEDSRVSELRNEVKIKGFESERTQMVHEETVKNLKERELEIEKLDKKIEVLTKEYYILQTSMEKRVVELETQLCEKITKLESYEKLEREMDNIVMQAAENDEEAEQVLFSYGYGANVPTNAKRRLKQSVQLARRVLQLERVNTSMRKEIDEAKTKADVLNRELKDSNDLLNQAQQPYNYLIESIRTRDTQLQKQKDRIAELEDNVRHLSKERNDLIKAKNQMSLDLEKLLNQREEMSVMKQVVLNMSASSHGNKISELQNLGGAKKTVHQLPHGTDMGVYKPGAIYLSKQEPPDWYKRLKKRHV